MTAMALSLDCSFLDLSDYDPAYDSPTSSQEDEPLDGKVLPLPRKQKLKRQHARPRNIYHSELSTIMTSPDPEHLLLALSDIKLPLVNFDYWVSGRGSGSPVNRAAVARVPEPQSSPTSWRAVSAAPHALQYSSTSSCSRELGTLHEGKTPPTSAPSPDRPSLLRNLKSTPPHPHRMPPPFSTSSGPDAYPHSNIDLVVGHGSTRTSKPVKRMEPGMSGPSCSIQLMSSFSLPDASTTSTNNPTILKHVEGTENHTGNSASSFEIIISSASGPLTHIHPNQLSSSSSTSSSSASSSAHTLKLKSNHPTQSDLSTHRLHRPWLANISLGKENLIDICPPIVPSTQED
ncbi:hypothetical protein VP01_2560g2 [Puccinia sorghi]|uniref:Uncharacterized protein n=1 Tax=Puccinia sorghi TaxID=27349 RepID=A0A0L6V6X9_9BASI|nr:hypothetical protein VP01_2560g2 [Puccinia sorghi]